MPYETLRCWQGASSGPFLDLYELIRHETVRLAMDLCSQFRAWRLDQAIHAASRFVEPVADIPDVVRLADLNVALVSADQRSRSQPGDMVMGVEISRHSVLRRLQ